jgi:hypothetical protein
MGGVRVGVCQALLKKPHRVFPCFGNAAARENIMELIVHDLFPRFFEGIAVILGFEQSGRSTKGFRLKEAGF